MQGGDGRCIEGGGGGVEGGRQEMDGGMVRKRKVVRNQWLMTEWNDYTEVKPQRGYRRFVVGAKMTR